jgi:NAD(P)-dependent dehydrogenase (short-subunit alcohol dehydrogenase family)
MADNYLEKKMEEHRQGTVAKRHKLSPSGQRPGELTIKFPSRRVFVTGGASGIGHAIVKAFCDSGCKVAFCDIDRARGTKTAQETGSQFHPVDVRNAEALDAALLRVIDAWGGIDVIVNNVGISEFKPLTELSLEEFDNVLATNLRPIIVTSRRMALNRENLAERSYGRIINISSTRAAMSETGTEAYSASKGGIRSLTHALMMSMAKYGVTVNCISPGWIECKEYATLREEDHEFHPSQRVGKPEDIARMCLWLCLPDNEFINGENITIDGGVSHKMIYPE